MSLPVVTAVHVLLGLVGIVAGTIAMAGLLRASLLRGWTLLFLAMTLTTTATGFLFPAPPFRLSHLLGLATLVLVALAVVALVVKRLEGRWRTLYVVAAMLTLYLQVGVLIAQIFKKVAPLAELEPTQGIWPLIAAEAVALGAFGAATLLGVARFRPSPIHLA